MVAKGQDKPKVTRISASDSDTDLRKSKVAKKQSATSSKAVKVKTSTDKKKRTFGPLGRVGGYFKGAWLELRQVHWPTRTATWGLTAAVLLFSAFFVVFITALDAGFKFIFEQILR